MMFDPRWGDPKKQPLTNGPVRITTPPQHPSPQLSGTGGQLLEVFLPFPIFTIDDKPWAALQLRYEHGLILMNKPLAVDLLKTPEGALSNESPDVFVTVLRLEVIPDDRKLPVLSGALQPLMTSFLKLVRAVGRQYWIFGGGQGYGAWYRGGSFVLAEGRIGQQNFAHFGQTVMVRPLTGDEWHWIGKELNARREIPVSELLFCDALTCISAADQARGVLELGVASEVGVTKLLMDRATQLGQQHHNARKFLEKNERGQVRFGEKLEQWPKKMGLIPAQEFTSGIDPLWHTRLITLYRFRNSVAHSGDVHLRDKTSKTVRALTKGELEGFVFAVEALHHWIQECREQIGIPAHTFRYKELRDRPVSAIVGDVLETGGFTVDTSWSWGPAPQPPGE
ncbi:MAG TPA: hypothetical protein VLA96_14710 [Terriglobales bacterium]|nr:hypothetical protein [Terriglobales bacterium]